MTRRGKKLLLWVGLPLAGFLLGLLAAWLLDRALCAPPLPPLRPPVIEFREVR